MSTLPKLKKLGERFLARWFSVFPNNLVGQFRAYSLGMVLAAGAIVLHEAPTKLAAAVAIALLAGTAVLLWDMSKYFGG